LPHLLLPASRQARQRRVLGIEITLRPAGVAVQNLETFPAVRLTSLPRLADFALWAVACETALCPAGTFARAYAANRKAAVEAIIEADPLAICVRKLMAERGSWAGTASDLLRAAADLADDNISKTSAGRPKIQASSPAACVARRLSFARWGLKCLLVGKGARRSTDDQDKLQRRQPSLDRQLRQHGLPRHLGALCKRLQRLRHSLSA
jgi:hypothetical protein